MKPVQRLRRNAEATKTRILMAAEELFAQRGYASVSVRDIADRAGVANSLLIRYYGSKAALFEEALLHAMYRRKFPYDKNDFAETMSGMILGDSGSKLAEIIVLAAGDPEAREIARRLAKAHMIQPLAEWLGPPEAEERAVAMLSLMTGSVLYRQFLNPAQSSPELGVWLAKALQALVAGAEPPDSVIDIETAPNERS